MNFENFKMSAKEKNEDLEEITKEDIQDYEQPGAEEIIELISEEVSAEDKEKIKEISHFMPFSLKAELVKTFKQQLELFKEVGGGLKEKINWDKARKRAVIGLGLYAFLNIIGGVAHAIENNDSDSGLDMNLGNELNDTFIRSTLSNAFNQLEAISISQEVGDLFVNVSIELAKKMQERGVEKIAYANVIERMLEWSKYVQDNKGSLRELQIGLDRISDEYFQNLDTERDQVESYTKSSEKNKMSIEIILPERVELEFGSHLSEVDKMNIQRFYDFTIEEIHESAQQFEIWGEKYGHKENFSKFEDKVKERIHNLIELSQQIEDNVANPDYNIKAYTQSAGGAGSKLTASLALESISNLVNLRSQEEKINDAFNF